MKITRQEFKAVNHAADLGDKDHGDHDHGDHDHTEVKRAVNDVWHPSMKQAALPSAPAPATPIGRAHLEKLRQQMQEAEAAQGVMHVSDEAVFAAHWNNMTPGARFVMVMCAGFTKEKCNQSLEQFSAAERDLIATMTLEFIPQLELGAKCMRGGRVADKTPPCMDAVYENRAKSTVH